MGINQFADMTHEEYLEMLPPTAPFACDFAYTDTDVCFSIKLTNLIFISFYFIF